VNEKNKKKKMDVFKNENERGVPNETQLGEEVIKGGLGEGGGRT